MTATAILAPIQTKTCTKCGEVKPATSEFFHAMKVSPDKFAWNCKVCATEANHARYYKDVQRSRDQAKEWRETNADKVKAARKIHYVENKARLLEANRQWRLKNIDYVRESNRSRANTEEYRVNRRSHYAENKAEIRKKSNAYRAQAVPAENHREGVKKWVSENKDKVNATRSRRRKERQGSDSAYMLRRRICGLIRQSIRVRGYTKLSRAHEILGCDFEFFKTHIERQFTKGMTWDNRSEWQIDHITPLATAKTEAEVIALNHYTNLRPLWAKDNLAKSDSIQYLI